MVIRVTNLRGEPVRVVITGSKEAGRVAGYTVNPGEKFAINPSEDGLAFFLMI